MAFVILRPFASDGSGLMADMPVTATGMPFIPVVHELDPRPDHVYLVPAGQGLTLKNGQLVPVRPERGGEVSHPIDSFLSALANDRYECCAVILLSGCGRDGVDGARMVHDAGGLVLVEPCADTGGPWIPEALSKGGGVDFVIPADEMPTVLARHADDLWVTRGRHFDLEARQVQAILTCLLEQTGTDFRYLRRAILCQRILQRMDLYGVSDPAAYLDLLAENPGEGRRLARDMAIGVAQFFRNPDEFLFLAERVAPRLIAGRASGDPVRIWVPGCSTGEEACSVAMVMYDAFRKMNAPFNIVVFATDIDSIALAKAKSGLYAENVVVDFPSDGIDDFFVRKPGGLMLNQSIRKSINFSFQNILDDPPLSQIDLISCRNLLSCMDPDAQQHMLSIFSLSVVNGGFLFLGKAETLVHGDGVFTAFEGHPSIYRRSDTNRRFPVAIPMPQAHFRQPQTCPGPRPARTDPRSLLLHDADFAEITHRRLSEIYAPASVLINAKGLPCYFSGPIAPYLDLSVRPTLPSLLHLVRAGLKGMVGRLLQHATSGGDASETVEATARIRHDGRIVPVHLSMTTALESLEGEALYLVCFSGLEPPTPPE